MRVLNSAEKEYRTVAAYQDEELQNMARDQIPVESLHEKAEAELRTIPSDSPFGFMEVLMVHLANWFQSEYMTWMNKPACFACCFPDTIGVGGDEPSEFERADSAGRVEVYECPECTCLTRFARYSDCRVLMRERRGRCGEYSNLFGLFATTMGYDIRLVVDFLDHIWCEFWSDKWNRWTHIDPSEGGDSMDNPLMYATGWKKEHVYVVATGLYEAVDVTERYNSNKLEVMSRRSPDDDRANAKDLEQFTSRLRANLSPSMIKMLLDRDKLEKEEFLNPPKRMSREAASIGRKSGNIEWRIARGEFQVEKTVLPKTGSVSLLTMSSLIHIVGSAKYSESLSNLGGSFIQLTLKETDKCGAVWANIAKEERLSCITVKFSFKILEAGADGLALVLQSHSPSAIGTAGSGLGYDGIPNSIAIEFDNFHSKTDKNDPNGCHISIQTRGKLSNSSHHSFSKGCSTNVPDFSDGSEVYVAAEFNVTEKLVQVYLGHESDYYCILAAPVSFDGVIDQDKDLYVGFTAATGGLCQEHQICSFEVFESHS